jgi:deazaflavin-dependent oxidoreductase (nitroreductase family)
MPTQSDALQRRLSQTQEIELTVTGRKSGRAISRPVWFVLDGNRLYLLPVSGAQTQWYKNVLQNPSIRIGGNGSEANLRVSNLTDAAQVSSIVDRFRSKYGAANVQKYYSKLDVAVVAELN